MRFTLHRPGQLHPVSTRCHGPSGRDVACCVDVRVRLVSACQAPEHRLPLAVLQCDVLAGVAGLRGVRGVDLLDPSGGLPVGSPTGSSRSPGSGSLGGLRRRTAGVQRRSRPLSRLVNSLKGVSSRRLRQEYVGCINRARTAGHTWHRPTSPRPVVGHRWRPSRCISEGSRGQTKQTLPPGPKGPVSAASRCSSARPSMSTSTSAAPDGRDSVL